MRSLAFVLTLLWSSTAFANQLIPANRQVTVAKSVLEVTSARDWNKLNARPGRQSETWTQDGELLNDLSFYGAIANDRTLFREVDRKNRPLPRFKGTMLLTDIPALLESSYRIARDTNIFTIDSSEPRQIAGRDGISFAYSFIGPDELRRTGEASALIVKGQLYMVTFEAPTLHYFARDVAAYRQIVDSLKLPK